MKLVWLGIMLFAPAISCYAQDTLRTYSKIDSSVVLREYTLNNETKQAHGLDKHYFEDGSLQSHIEYENGKIWNVYVFKHPINRNPLETGTIKDGTGTVFYYNKNGILESVRTYLSGLLHGLSIKYYSNGQIRMKGSYSQGHRCGTWHQYAKTGELKEDGERDFGEPCDD